MKFRPLIRKLRDISPGIAVFSLLIDILTLFEQTKDFIFARGAVELSASNFGVSFIVIHI